MSVWNVWGFLQFWLLLPTPHFKSVLKWARLLVSDHAAHLVDARGERTEAHLLGLADAVRAGLLPLVGNGEIFVSVDQEVEATFGGGGV